jgi:RNA polymerase sigma factor (sigma-70 family)
MIGYKIFVGHRRSAGIMLMKMTISDLELLRRYVEFASNEAFEELISRHTGLVYSAALRQVRNLELAEDVAQSVFITLSQKADRLPSNVILSGWLYRTTLYAASKAIRREYRRETREHKATTMNSSDTEVESAWKQIEPYLESSMRKLAEKDRTALVLRYLENKSLREVGTALGTSDDAAQKRVSRALERLRALFAQRKICVSSTALAGGLSSFGVEAAPVILKTAISAAISSATLTTGGLTSIATVLNKTIMITKLKIAIAAGVTVAITQFGAHQKTTRALQTETESLRTANSQLQDLQSNREVDSDLLAELTQLRDKAEEVLTLRSQVSALRQENAKLNSGIETASNENDAEVDDSIPKNPQARMKLAGELFKEGNFEKALEHLIWCYDKGAIKNPSFIGVRSSFLLNQFAELGNSYPPAREALIARRDDVEDRLKEGSNDTMLALDLTRLNSSLGEGDRTVELFDQFPEGDPRRGTMVEVAYDELLKANRYDDIFAAVTPEAYFGKRAQNTTRLLSQYQDNKTLQATVLNQLILKGGMAIETLAGANQPQRAIDLIDQVLGHDSSQQTIEDLMRHVTRAENSEVLEYLENK